MAKLAGYHAVTNKFPTREKEIKKMPKSYIIDVIYSVIGEDFKKWVHKQVKDRNDKIARERKLLINVDPGVYDAFQRSTAVST